MSTIWIRALQRNGRLGRLVDSADCFGAHQCQELLVQNNGLLAGHVLW